MLLLAIPTTALSPMFADLLGYSVPDNPATQTVLAVLGTVLYFWGGWPFLSGGADEVRERSPGMMLLIALGITVAYLSSLGATVGALPHDMEFWWELALLIVIMLLGHWLEMRSLAHTSSALDSLAALLPDDAERIDRPGTVDETVVTVAPAELVVGDTVLIRPGGRVPADGRILDGLAEMDESMITGESRAVPRETGDTVVAGTVATDSGLRVQVTAVGADTELAGIQQMVADAQLSSTRAQRLADRAAGWLFWFALVSAALAAGIWAAVDGSEAAVVRAITVLVIACPHALGLAIPLVVSIVTERAAGAGVLVKDRLSLETMRTVDAVLFDKTGTLTTGEPVVTGVLAADSPESAAPADADEAARRVLALAAAAESDSEHPLARAVVGAARELGLQIPRATDFSSAPAEGVTARVEGRTIAVGGPYLLERHGREELGSVEPWRERGSIILHVLDDGEVIGALELADEIRPESAAAVRALHDRGAEVMIITGDAAAVAESVGAELGIDRVYAGVRPEDKAAKVTALQREGRTVAMVGDGVNDAPALAAADVGIAIGAGTDVAIASAGVVLAGDDPRAVLTVIDLSRAGYTKMRQNLWWASGYNLVAVPLAAGVLAPVGFVLPMAVGAAVMSASTIIVAANAQLLRRLDLTPPAE